MSFLGNVFRAVAPIIGGAVGGPVGAAVGGVLAGAGRSGGGPVARPGGAAIPMAFNPMGPPDLPTGGGADIPSPPPDQAPTGLQCIAERGLHPSPHTKAGKPRAWRVTKNGRCTWHKKPAMNAMNPHAARRAIHRITKARRLLVSIERSLPKRHQRAAARGGRGNYVEVVKA